ncbi:hypothetical protein [Rhodoferax sp.]
MSVVTTSGDPNQVVPLIRERQVLDPVASGQSNKVIGDSAPKPKAPPH